MKNEIIIKKAKKLEDNLAEYYLFCVDVCGEDDEANTKPAKEALMLSRNILAYLEATA